jgi:general secretion pathway protein G
MDGSKTRGFTLVEILIVVIILAILAAIVIPQFSMATTDARVSTLRADLQTIRNQLETYKFQHYDTYPGAAMQTQMMQFSNVAGETSATQDTTYYLGPYLSTIPINPVSGSRDVRIVSGTTTFAAPTADAGWWYNSTSGQFRADLADFHTTGSGVKYNDL